MEEAHARRGCAYALVPIGISMQLAYTPSRRSSRKEGIAPNEVDPVPISVFLDYATWFQDSKRVMAVENLVSHHLYDSNGETFEALLDQR